MAEESRTERDDSGESVPYTNGSPETQRGKELQAARLSPGLRKWILQQLTDEEVAAALLDLRELRETGGLELPEFIQELEQVVKPSQSTER